MGKKSQKPLDCNQKVLSLYTDPLLKIGFIKEEFDASISIYWKHDRNIVLTVIIRIDGQYLDLRSIIYEQYKEEHQLHYILYPLQNNP